MAVTLRDIARSVGVSDTVVSKVINAGSSNVRVSDETRARVLSAARRLGYRPHGAARSMRRGKIGAIALLLPSDSHCAYLPPHFTHDLTRVLAAHDLHLAVESLSDEKLTDQSYVPRMLRELSVDGLILNYIAAIPQRIIGLVHEFEIPAVWLNSKLPSNCIYPDDYHAAAQITRRLVDAGHRRIAYVCFGMPGHYSQVDRRAGFQATMRQAGLEPWMLEKAVPPHSMRHAVPGDDRLQLARQLLSSPSRPTAVVAYEAIEAYPLIHAAAQLELEIGTDLSIAGFHFELIEGSGVPVCTMVHDTRSMAQASVEMLLKKIQAPGESASPVAVPFQWMECDSIGRPRPERGTVAETEAATSPSQIENPVPLQKAGSRLDG